MKLYGETSQSLIEAIRKIAQPDIEKDIVAKKAFNEALQERNRQKLKLEKKDDK